MSSIGPSFGTPEQRPLPTTQQGNAVENNLQGADLTSQPVISSMNTFTGKELTPSSQVQTSITLFPQQWLLLLRNLLQLPTDITKLLLLLAKTEVVSLEQNLLSGSLLNDEAPVSLEALQTLLQNKLTQAQEKLIKLTQGNAVTLMDAEGHSKGSLLGSLSDLSQKTEKSPMQALHSTFTLYLTAYPLPPPQGFFLRFEVPSSAEEQEGSSDPSLVIFIQTIALGLFKIVLTLIKSHGYWQIEIEHDAQAAELTEVIQNNVETAIGDMVIQPQGIRWFFLQKQTRSFMNEEGIHPEFEDEKKVEKGKAEKPLVGLYPGSGVSLREILLAYLLIRIILDLDDGRGIIHDP